MQNTIAGTARRYSRVAAAVEHPAGTWTWLETDAAWDGTLFFDFSAQVDWEYGNAMSVGQYFNANSLVSITENSPELVVIPPAEAGSATY